VNKTSAVCGLLSVVFYVLENAMIVAQGAGAPQSTAMPHVIRSYFVSHRAGIFEEIGLDAIYNVLLLLFFAGLWLALNRRDGGKELKWRRETIWAGAAYLAITLASYLPDTVLTQSNQLSEAQVAAFWGVDLVLSAAATFPLALMLIAFASDQWRARYGTSWQSRWGIVGGICLLIGETSFLITDPNTAAEVATATLSGGISMAVWVIALSLTMLRETPD